MQEFNNTAINESANTDCIYFNECYLQLRNNGYCFSKCKDFHSQINEEIKNKLRRGLALTVKESWDLYQYIKTLDNELKAYREDTRFADLYERICIKRDDDREYFARTKDKTYITRIAEKEMFIHMMQDMMFDRYGVEEVNADEDSD